MPSSKPTVFLVSGGDVFQRGKAIQSILRDRFGSEEAEKITLDAAKDGAVAQALDEVRSYSLFSTGKAVFLENADQILDDEIALLTRFLSRPSGDTLLFVLHPEGKKPGVKLLKPFPKESVFSLEKTSPDQVRELIQKKLASRKIQIQKDALHYLMDVLGDRVEFALQETEKILLWAEEGQTLNLEDCRRLVMDDSEEEIWAITRTVAEKKTGEALDFLHRLVNQGESPIGIVALLARLFRQMYHCKALEKERVPAAEWPARVGLSKYPLDITRKNSQRFSLRALQSGLVLLRQADEDLKGGKPGSPEGLKDMVLERLIVDLCRLDTGKGAG